MAKMHENSGQQVTQQHSCYSSSQSCQQWCGQLRSSKRPLSSGDHVSMGRNCGTAYGRNSRSKSSHYNNETVIKGDESRNNINCIHNDLAENNNNNSYLCVNYDKYESDTFDAIDDMPNDGIDISLDFVTRFANDSTIATKSHCKYANLKSFNTNTSHDLNGVKMLKSSITANNFYDNKANKDFNNINNNNNSRSAQNESDNDMHFHSNDKTNNTLKSTSILKSLLQRNAIENANSQPNAHISTAVVDCGNAGHTIPTQAEKAQFRRSLDSATNLVFHHRSLPLTSSPAPMRKSGTCFDFDSSLTSVNAIKKALFEKEPEVRTGKQKRVNTSSSPPSTTISSLLGSFEESVLNGRLEPASTVEGFTAEIGASGSFCPRHITLPVTVFFYTLQDTDKADKVSSPYLGHINLGKKGYRIPRKGTVQATLFNPHGTVVKMFVVRYDLSDMPPNSRTFLRQRTLFMPSDANENDIDNRKWLRYLIHLRFASSKSGRIYLHTDVRVIVFRKHDLDVATINGTRPYELRSFTQYPKNPKYS